MGVPLLDLGIDDVESNHCEAEDEGGGDLPGCVKLWRSVVANTVNDALSPTPSRERDRARTWLTTASPDHQLALLWQIFCVHGIPKSLFL
jgi:hypothetical protein